MKEHTNGSMYMVLGIVPGNSLKQHIHTKRSTENELVDTSNYIPWTIWTKIFLMGQGYNLKINVLDQDNKSVIKMESNGRMSAKENSTNIHMRYFIIKDIIRGENIELIHYPTEISITYYVIKSLQ